MRHSLVIWVAALVASSTAAFAGECPDLSGQYLTSDRAPFSISQKSENGVTTYNYGGEIWIADGQPHGDFAPVTVVCKNNSVVKTIDYSTVGRVNSVETYSLDPNGSLVESVESPGPFQPSRSISTRQ